MRTVKVTHKQVFTLGEYLLAGDPMDELEIQERQDSSIYLLVGGSPYCTIDTDGKLEEVDPDGNVLDPEDYPQPPSPQMEDLADEAYEREGDR